MCIRDSPETEARAYDRLSRQEKISGYLSWGILALFAGLIAFTLYVSGETYLAHLVGTWLPMWYLAAVVSFFGTVSYTHLVEVFLKGMWAVWLLAVVCALEWLCGNLRALRGVQRMRRQLEAVSYTHLWRSAYVAGTAATASPRSDTGQRDL